MRTRCEDVYEEGIVPRFVCSLGSMAWLTPKFKGPDVRRAGRYVGEEEGVESTDGCVADERDGKDGKEVFYCWRVEGGADEGKGEDIWNVGEKFADDCQHVDIQPGSLHPMFKNIVSMCSNATRKNG